MGNLSRLINKANDKQCRLLFMFDPEEIGEQWGIKFYPHADDDEHFYAFNHDLDTAARILLDELRGFNEW